MKYKRWVVVCVLTICIIQTSNALTVIADMSNTISAKPFLKDIQLPNEALIMKEIQNQKSMLDKKIVIKSNLYPIKSNFEPGRVARRKLKTSHFTKTPLFVVGSDSKSLRWLSINKNYLKKIHAIGMITNVENEETAKHIEKKTGLSLLPANINGLEKFVGTKHYPFLIKDNWVLQ